MSTIGYQFFNIILQIVFIILLYYIVTCIMRNRKKLFFVPNQDIAYEPPNRLPLQNNDNKYLLLRKFC